MHSAAPGGMRKMRDPVTHQIAVPHRTRDGKQVLRTPNGTTLVSRPLDRPKPKK